jgi:hypothetical protein
MSSAAVWQQPETLPFTPFLARKNCLSRLLKQTRRLDLQVFWTIKRLLPADSPAIVKYVKDHFRDPRPLVEKIAKTQNSEKGKVIDTLAISHPEVPLKIQGLIHLHLTKFPVATVLDFIILCPDMKKIIKDDQFPKGVLEHSRFTVSDVKVVTVFHYQLWCGAAECVVERSQQTQI